MSLYFPEKKALFLHVPRTGGRWIVECVEYSGIEIDTRWSQRANKFYSIYNHALLAHYDPECLVQVDFMFAFVRHPVDLYPSFWRMGKSSTLRHPAKADEYFADPMRRSIESIFRWNPNFDEWLEEMLEEEPGWATRLFERFVGPEGAEFCHFVGRTETIEQDVACVMDALGYGAEWSRYYEKDYPRHERKVRTKYSMPTVEKIELTESQRERIERSERVAIRRFFGEESSKRRSYRRKNGEFIHGERTFV